MSKGATITEIGTQDLANIIESLSNGDLTHEAAYEIAFFIEEVWSDGITFELLRRVANEAAEYDDFKDLCYVHLGNDIEDPFAWIRKEEEDEELTDEECEEKLIERMQDDDGVTILRVGKHWVVID